MHFPSATYRVQTSPEFQLRQINHILPYLDALGISTVYSAPFFQARRGSAHGYDVANPHQIGDEIGDDKTFQTIADDLKNRHMGWLQDIVPNHMAFTSQNPWIRQLLELGSHSPYYGFFDINWLSEDQRYYGKVMMPFLGSSLQEAMSQHEIQLAYGQNGFCFSYFDHEFPLRAESYYPLLQKQHAYVKEENPGEEISNNFFSLLAELEKWHHGQIDNEPPEGWQKVKDQLQQLVQGNEVIRNALQRVLDTTNRDISVLKALLLEQNYYLTWWKDTESEINYRRFFTVNDLICLNIQEPDVFREYHRFIKDLVDQKLVQGLRVDHIDGLLDPTKYLQELRAMAGPDTYLVVEKILEGQEKMPRNWPIQGTSGYEFLAIVSQLFTASTGEKELTDLYTTIVPHLPSYRDLVYQNKMFILMNRMGGELNNLMSLLKKLDIVPYQDATEEDEYLKQALAHLLVAFPVYRIYGNKFPFSDEEMEIIAEAFTYAESKAPSLSTYFQRLREIFNGVPDRDETQNNHRLYFVMRCQQFTGPLTAKGVEDTTFYVYHRLISHNEVGDTPAVFGISTQAFHQNMKERNPHSLNATATHDTKRGEDARLRINVLSEIPEVWKKQYHQWKKTNKEFLTRQAGKTWPDDNDEYFLYQTLVGTYPVHIDPEQENYRSRLKDYLLKAIKEAKRNTSWSSPNEAYENAATDFAEKIMSHQPFIRSLEPFVKNVAQRAVIYSLGQILLKITAPGIPDVYQGSEYWDLSMVDPDNRRPVDYQQRWDALQELQEKFEKDAAGLAESLSEKILDPAIKLFTMHRALHTRRELKDFFLEAVYLPVAAKGSKAQHLVSFLRTGKKQQAITLVPIHISPLELKEHLPVGEGCWQDTSVSLPSGSQGAWTNIFTKETVQLSETTPVAQILKKFPVALLIKN